MKDKGLKETFERRKEPYLREAEKTYTNTFSHAMLE